MLNLTKEQMLAEGFTPSQIASQLAKQTQVTQAPTRRVFGFTGTVEEGIFTVLSKESGLNDVEVIERLHDLDVELNDKERLEVSFKLLNMFNEGKLARVKGRVFEYSIA